MTHEFGEVGHLPPRPHRSDARAPTCPGPILVAMTAWSDLDGHGVSGTAWTVFQFTMALPVNPFAITLQRRATLQAGV